MSHGRKFEKKVYKILKESSIGYITRENFGSATELHLPDIEIGLKNDIAFEADIGIECKSDESGKFDVHRWVKSEQGRHQINNYKLIILIVEVLSSKVPHYEVWFNKLTPSSGIVTYKKDTLLKLSAIKDVFSGLLYLED